MKILFINAKIAGGIPWVPIGMASMASYLQKYGIDVKIINNNLSNLTKEKLSQIIDEFNPTIVGTGGMTVQSQDALQIGAMVKQINKNITLLYGGVHFTFLPNDGLKYGDVCVIGEGKDTTLEICSLNNLKNVKGIAYYEDGEVITSEPRPFIQNLDKVPIPAYGLLEMDRYKDHLITGEKAISILTGRGCPYNCEFCALPRLWQRKVRYFPLDYVIDHIKFLIKNYNLKNLRIMDDTMAK